MKTARKVLLVVSLVYVVLTIILLLNEETLYNRLNLLDLMGYFKMWMVLGILLLTGVLLVYSLHIHNLQKALRRLEGEHAATKARVYDIEAARKDEDEQAGRRIEAFRSSLDKGGRGGTPPPPSGDATTPPKA